MTQFKTKDLDGHSEETPKSEFEQTNESSALEPVEPPSTEDSIPLQEEPENSDKTEVPDDPLEVLKHVNKEVLTADELYKLKVLKLPFLVGGFIPKYGITIITGQSDTNKSTFLRQLGLSIVNGDSTFLGAALNTKYKKAIMVTTEDMKVNVSALLNKQIPEGTDPSKLQNLKFLFSRTGVIGKLQKILEKEKADLIIVDTWTDTFGGDLNQANKVRESLQQFNVLSETYGCTILALHHQRKVAEGKAHSKDDVLGSMGIQAIARSVIEMRRDQGNRRILSILKGNYVSDQSKGLNLVMELNEDTMRFDKFEIVNQIPSGIQGKARRFTPEEKEAIMKKVRPLFKEGLSLDKIREMLSNDVQIERVPSKGTLHEWVTEDSQSAESLVDS